MKAGTLRHRITIQINKGASNEYGEPVDDWIDVKTVSAGVYPISGKEFFAAETINSEVSHKISIRYTPGINPSMRVKFKDRYFDIISIINFQEVNREMQLMCRELI